jgi:putative two-component system response regulator
MTLPPYRLLLVEDDAMDARVFELMLAELDEPLGTVARATTLAAAIDHVRAHPVDVVFLDLDLPDSEGIETVERFAASGISVPIVVLTGHGDEEMGLRAVAFGAQDYLVKHDIHAHVLARVVRFAVQRHVVRTHEENRVEDENVRARGAASDAANEAVAAEVVRRTDDRASATEAIEGAYEGAIEGWARVLELRDQDTLGHSRRVADLATEVARRLDLPEDEVEGIRRGALLHDIGKVAVPDAILRKEGPLDAKERKTMEQHTEFARELLEPIDFLRTAIDVPYAHHERWDGSGYPRGLAGDDIPLAARIFAVVDVFDALTRDRPYRSAWSRKEALAYIERASGRLFDPQVVAAFADLHA